MDVEEINKLIQSSDIDKGEISDSYHTFGELYSHRVALFIALCQALIRVDEGYYENLIYKTRFDSEGKYCGDGWFIMGINPKGKEVQLSYHLPMEKWDECSFVKTLDKAPTFDGHTSADVIKRLQKLFP